MHLRDGTDIGLGVPNPVGDVDHFPFGEAEILEKSTAASSGAEDTSRIAQVVERPGRVRRRGPEARPPALIHGLTLTISTVSPDEGHPTVLEGERPLGPAAGRAEVPGRQRAVGGDAQQHRGDRVPVPSACTLVMAARSVGQPGERVRVLGRLEPGAVSRRSPCRPGGPAMVSAMSKTAAWAPRFWPSRGGVAAEPEQPVAADRVQVRREARDLQRAQPRGRVGSLRSIV